MEGEVSIGYGELSRLLESEHPVELAHEAVPSCLLAEEQGCDGAGRDPRALASGTCIRDRKLLTVLSKDTVRSFRSRMHVPEARARGSLPAPSQPCSSASRQEGTASCASSTGCSDSRSRLSSP